MSSFRVDPLRGDGPLYGDRRRAAVAACGEIADAIAAIDKQLAALDVERRALRQKLRVLHRRIAPNLAKRAGRAPAPDGTEQLPPVRHDAIALWGRRLRSVCLALLRGRGAMPLTELHALLHRHGYVIANRAHVKALADALAYEVDQGRVRRVARGVYQLVDGPLPAPGRHGNPPLRQLDPEAADAENPRFSATRNAASERFSV